MDPNANLAEQRSIARRIMERMADADDIARLAELLLALDTWLSSGGFLPDDWADGDDKAARAAALAAR